MTQILEISDLTVSLHEDLEEIQVLQGVTLGIDRGEVVGIVGESGSGKSMLALATVGLLPGNIRVTAGSIRFDGVDLTALPQPALNKLRGARISMIFQEPMSALNPLMRAGDQVLEVIRAHLHCGQGEAEKRMHDVLDEVGLRPPQQIAMLYPHELSGGMRQRVMIAVATACSPDVIIADEPTTALDVTVQAQILGLLRSIVERRGCSLVLISHDIGVINAMCHRVVVMYAGSVVEDCRSADFLRRPSHPYSKLLLETYVDIDQPPMRPLPTIAGAMPQPTERKVGCRFSPRCPETIDVCRRLTPMLEGVGDGHRAACHRRSHVEAIGSAP